MYSITVRKLLIFKMRKTKDKKNKGVDFYLNINNYNQKKRITN